MLTEILIYIALFATLFSGAFAAAFQTVDAVRYLQVQKDTIDGLYFLQSKLDSLVESSSNWGTLSLDDINQLIPPDGELSIESFSSEIFDTATSSGRVLCLTLGINKKIYTFYYVQEK
jgi:hypothetical protein